MQHLEVDSEKMRMRLNVNKKYDARLRMMTTMEQKGRLHWMYC